MTKVIIGGDVGGTSSKIAAMSTSGELLTVVRGGGGNIRSSGENALDNIMTTVRSALALIPDPKVVSAHLGISGAGPARFTDIDSGMRQRWKTSLLPVAHLSVGSDLEVAFAGASPIPDGVLLLSGTGAVATALHDYHIVGRCDGMGWLLGDEGSGTWLGVQAIISVAKALDHRGPATALTPMVLDRLRTLDPEVAERASQLADRRQELIAYAYSMAPAKLGQLAPLVFEADTDPVAQHIQSRAVNALLNSAKGALLEAAASAGSVDFSQSLVLAGSILDAEGPLNSSIREIWPSIIGTEPIIYDQAPPLAGALLLAARNAGLSLSLKAIRDTLIKVSP